MKYKSRHGFCESSNLFFPNVQDDALQLLNLKEVESSDKESSASCSSSSFSGLRSFFDTITDREKVSRPFSNHSFLNLLYVIFIAGT